MINKINDIEIMSPAGSYESLMAAIQAGAGSVYFGIGALNMRSRSAANFDYDDLKNICEICSQNGVKSYLTVNTVLYDDDLKDMRQIIDAAKENGVSAVIASDHAAIEYARSKGVEVHISTQLSISNIESVKFYSNFADVIVLARELNLNQIKSICLKIDEEDVRGPSGEKVRIEIFVHGALCMAISGKCYLSLHEANHSANRGDCLQTCRKSYTVREKQSGYELDISNENIMSPKDLCTLGFLDKILDTGVKVLKIEGRGRSPEYVKTVTRAYREAVDAIRKGSYNDEKIAHWTEQLKAVFNRGFWDGYYLGRKLGEWTGKYGSNATKKKEYVGKATNYYQKIGVGEFLIESGEISEGDELLIIGPTTGVVEGKAHGITVGHKEGTVAVKGDTVTFKTNELIRRSDKLYRLINRNGDGHS
ncbi:MAG: peptidase U32 family protein [Candidatus Kapaibacterium sp.]